MSTGADPLAVQVPPGGNGAGLPTPPSYARLATIDPVNGSNATASFFNGIPYQTAAAAFAGAEALALAGEPSAAIYFSPGAYAEDVAFQAQPPSAFQLGIFGQGRTHVAALRSLTITPPTAGNTLQVTIANLSTGSVSPGAQTVPGLSIGDDGGAGSAFVTLQDCYLLTQTNAIDAFVVEDNGGTGLVSVSLNGGIQVSHPGSSGGVGMRIGRGRVFGGGNTEIGSDGAPAVLLGGTASLNLNDAACNVDAGAGNINAIEHGAGGAITLTNVLLTPRGNGQAVLAGGGTVFISAALLAVPGTGGISNPAGVVAIGNVATAAGLFPPIVAAALVRIGPVESLGYAAAGAVGVVWAVAAPTDPKTALDRIAAAVAAGVAGPIA